MILTCSHYILAVPYIPSCFLCCSEASGEPAFVLLAIMIIGVKVVLFIFKLKSCERNCSFSKERKGDKWFLRIKKKQTIKQNNYDCLIC